MPCTAKRYPDILSIIIPSFNLCNERHKQRLPLYSPLVLESRCRVHDLDILCTGHGHGVEAQGVQKRAGFLQDRVDWDRWRGWALDEVI